MKLHESLVKQGCLDGTIEFEAHDRVPFFIVEGIPVIGEEEIECYSETYNGVQYVKMDSTHKNADGSYSGAEPTYSSSMSQERQKLWAEQYELVTVDQMKELRRLDAMTLEEYKKYLIDEYTKEKNKVDFEITIDSEARGEKLQYTFNLKTYSELRGQVVSAIQHGTPYIAWHDDTLLSHDLINPYTVKQGAQIVYDAEQKIAEKDGQYDMYKERANLLTQKVDREVLEALPNTIEEDAYIQAIKNGVKPLIDLA